MKFLLIFLFPFTLLSQTFGTHIQSVYKECGLENHLSYSVFYVGMVGYYNLVGERKITGDKLVIVDYRQSSHQNRFYIINLTTHTLLCQTLVAHGRNSGKLYPIRFSNKKGSYKSSLGFYVTAESYYGTNGLSLNLDGLEKEYNSNARARRIVLHGASYVNADNMGRSLGCIVLPLTDIEKIITLIKDGNCLLVYTKQYTGRYLNIESAKQYYYTLLSGKKVDEFFKE